MSPFNGKHVEQYFTVVLFVFHFTQFVILRNLSILDLGTVGSERVELGLPVGVMICSRNRYILCHTIGDLVSKEAVCCVHYLEFADNSHCSSPMLSSVL